MGAGQTLDGLVILTSRFSPPLCYFIAQGKDRLRSKVPSWTKLRRLTRSLWAQ